MVREVYIYEHFNRISPRNAIKNNISESKII